jgi:hypothetical protein
MASQPNKIRFRSGIGWLLQSITLRPQDGTSAEVRFTDKDGHSLLLTLKGVRSVENVVAALSGIDDFEILRREDTTPHAEFACYVCRFYRDDDLYDTIIDNYEIGEAKSELVAAPNICPVPTLNGSGAVGGPPAEN